MHQIKASNFPVMVTFPMTNESKIQFSHTDSLRQGPVVSLASSLRLANCSQGKQSGQMRQEVSDTLPSWLPGCGPV